jgi:hypothetical protein
MVEVGLTMARREADVRADLYVVRDDVRMMTSEPFGVDAKHCRTCAGVAVAAGGERGARLSALIDEDDVDEQREGEQRQHREKSGAAGWHARKQEPEKEKGNRVAAMVGEQRRLGLMGKLLR